MSTPEIHWQEHSVILRNGLHVMKTRFGNCLVGKIGAMQPSNYKTVAHQVNTISTI